MIYEAGELKVITYKNGRQWATDVVRTAGKAASLQLISDRSIIAADGKDLSFITLRVLDNRRTIVPEARNHIKFKISGPGEIIATDNGDSSDFTSFHSKERNTFNGLALVIVRTKSKNPGTIKITAESDGCRLRR